MNQNGSFLLEVANSLSSLRFETFCNSAIGASKLFGSSKPVERCFQKGTPMSVTQSKIAFMRGILEDSSVLASDAICFECETYYNPSSKARLHVPPAEVELPASLFSRQKQTNDKKRIAFLGGWQWTSENEWRSPTLKNRVQCACPLGIYMNCHKGKQHDVASITNSQSLVDQGQMVSLKFWSLLRDMLETSTLSSASKF